ncbi:uncharacterized protein LOC143217150 [Lasioglossum baleicum]|uniref:uncharacterized protein LOC143217150 n=1 Tax=Lasioglossum baleicum TaxID=434251 RepID=UPI003FCEBB26
MVFPVELIPVLRRKHILRRRFEALCGVALTKTNRSDEKRWCAPLGHDDGALTRETAFFPEPFPR